jgi:PTH1 family peptidyl-tRNA hydrolase
MKLVVGLGNPGRQYLETRHNVGFMVAAKLVPMVAATPPRTRFQAEVMEGRVDGEKVVVLCPQTYMNASGKSVRQAFDFFKLTPADVLVVSDDLNLSLGRLRVRSKGSAGGQKGLADIIRLLQSEEIPRLRIGIDPPPAGWAVPDYVLSKFKRSEQPEVDAATERAAYAALDWVRHGIEFCMNQYNANP